MERRAFLALLAAAPIAALAPLPKFLPPPRPMFHRDAFKMAAEGLERPHRFVFNYKTSATRYEFLDSQARQATR